MICEECRQPWRTVNGMCTTCGNRTWTFLEEGPRSGPPWTEGDWS